MNHTYNYNDQLKFVNFDWFILSYLDQNSTVLSKIDHFCPKTEELMSGIHYIRIQDHLKLLNVCQHLDQFCSFEHSKVIQFFLKKVEVIYRVRINIYLYL